MHPFLKYLLYIPITAVVVCVILVMVASSQELARLAKEIGSASLLVIVIAGVGLLGSNQTAR